MNAKIAKGCVKNFTFLCLIFAVLFLNQCRCTDSDLVSTPQITETSSVGPALPTTAPSTDEVIAGTETATGTATTAGTTAATTTGTTTAAIEPTQFDFTTGTLPEFVTTSTCDLTSSGFVLPKEDSGDYVSECYFDIPVKSDTLVNSLVELTTARYDLIAAGDFANLTASDILLYAPKTATSKRDKATGFWFSSALWPSLQPTIIMGDDGSNDMSISGSGGLVQYFKINPDEDYKLSFTTNTASLTDAQTLFLSLAFYDKNFRALNFTYPIDKTTKSSLSNFRKYANDYKNSSADFTDSFFIHTIDCETFTTYVGGTATSADDETINPCIDSSGNPQTNEDGEVYSADDIAYASIAFNVNYKTDGEPATLKEVRLEHRNQIQIELFDEHGDSLQESDGLDEFYVESFTGDATLRVYLRSLAGSKTPLVSKLNLDTTKAVSVSIGSLIAEFEKPRMGFTGGANPPIQEYVDSDIMRTECLDYFDNNMPINCLIFFNKYDFNRVRTNIPVSDFYTTMSGSSYAFNFHDGTRANTLEPITRLKHLKQIADAGLDIEMIVFGSCEGTYWFNKTFNCYWDTSGNLNAEYDPNTSDATNDMSVSFEIMNEFAKNMVTLFDGTHSAIFSTEAIALPRISSWQIGVETNIAENVWYTNLSDSEEAQLLGEQADAVYEIQPDASIQTSVNPYNSSRVQTFDYDYLETVLSHIDTTHYTHFNFNTFNDGIEIQPEDWLADFQKLKEQDYFINWTDKPLVVGAYDYTHNLYDPNPTCFTKWQKDSGIERAAKLTARMILVDLSLPTAEIYDYAIFNTQGYSGRSITYHECWRSEDMSNILDLDTTTGYFAGKDEASQYKLNEIGIATLTLAKNISTSSPYETTTTSEINGLFTSMFKDKNGQNVLAVWQQDQHKYATDYMFYMSDNIEYGLQDTRPITLTLTNIRATGATLISLDGSADQAVTATASGVADTILTGIVLHGDAPVLIRLD